MDDLLVMRSTKRVLSVGNDPELLWLRHAVLKHAGFDLQTVANAKEALEKIRAGNYGVLLMCYSFDVETRKQLADTFRDRCPDRRIVSVANRQVAPPYFGDVVVYGLDGPEALIEAIQGAFPERELNIQGLALNQPKHRNQAENE